MQIFTKIYKRFSLSLLQYIMVHFVSLGGWCGTKIALKQLDLFDEASLPFDDVRTSIEGVIDCIENDFANFFPPVIEQDPRFHNWSGFVGEYVGFFHPYHNLLDEDIMASFRRKIQRFITKFSQPNMACFMRTIIRDDFMDELKYYKKLQETIDQRYPECKYIVCYMITSQERSQYIKHLDERTFVFALNDNCRDAERMGEQYKPILDFLLENDLFTTIPPPNDFKIVNTTNWWWLINDYPCVNHVEKDYPAITDIDLIRIDKFTPEYTGKKYTLSVGSMFKNEAWAMVEWIEHHIRHGVDHFFMVNDGSTDNSVELLQPYIDRGLVTLFDADWKYYWGRQRDLYNHYFLPILKHTQWFIILDLDEFFWSKSYTNLKDAFACCSHLGQIQFQWRMFGSNNHEKQPASIVEGFTKRQGGDLAYNDVWSLKYAVNSNYEFLSFDIHHANFANKEDEQGRWQIIGEPVFALNHYCCQSREFWNKVKCTRGDSDDFRKRVETDFDLVDFNEVEDTELLDRNINIGCLIRQENVPTTDDLQLDGAAEEPEKMESTEKKYYLAVGCIFKNEAHSIVEWVKFYLRSGVQHFYMINDGSTDNSVELLQPYIDEGLISLFESDWGRHFGRQGEMYTHFIFPQLHQTQWLLMVDTDEYLWSKISHNLRDVFQQCSHIPQIQFHHTIFGSNGHITQPRSVIQGFTRRASEAPTKSMWNVKYAINTACEFDHLGIHYAKFKHDHTPDDCLIIGEPYFILNHYSCQSREIWNTVKCTRGDGDNYRVRTEADFDAIDLNEEEDTELADLMLDTKPTVHMVVARYKEDLEWIFDDEINRFLDEWVDQILIYNKSENLTFVGTLNYECREMTESSQLPRIHSILPLPNIGGCDHTYLHYIVDNYNNLADITIFVPGSLELDYKMEKAKELLRAIDLHSRAVFCYRDTKDDGILEAFYNFELLQHQSADPVNVDESTDTTLVPAAIRPFGKWYDAHFGQNFVNHVTYMGIFSVDKRDILQHPKSYYERLLADFPDAANTEVAHYIERAWAAVFHPMTHTKLFMGNNW